MNILDCIRKLDIALVTSDEQFQQAMGIRRRVYCDEISWLTPDTLVDEWDYRAEHFLASLRGQSIATARMLSTYRGALEIEKYIDLDDYRAVGKCAEVSRLCTLSDVRFSPVAVGMFRAFYRYAIVNDIRFVCITAAAHYRRMYLDIGFEHVGGPFRNELLNNTLHDAYVMAVERLEPLWAERRPRMLEMFLQLI